MRWNTSACVGCVGDGPNGRYQLCRAECAQGDVADISYVGLDVHKATVCVAAARERARWEDAADRGLRTARRSCAKCPPVELLLRSWPLRIWAARFLTGRGHSCIVVAPSLIPMKSGDRVKTDRREPMMLAKLHRASELTAIWMPDAAHEAMRDLVRARAMVGRVLAQARQHLRGFLLRHDRSYRGPRAWTLACAAG
jgi:transposase